MKCRESRDDGVEFRSSGTARHGSEGLARALSPSMGSSLTNRVIARGSGDGVAFQQITRMSRRRTFSNASSQGCQSAMDDL